nr:NAD-dependent epimerase/dehydratase family protein [Bifidobacterium sp. DSM 109958]
MVLGGSGFIGSALNALLLESIDTDVVVFDASQPRSFPDDARVRFVKGFFDSGTDFDQLTKGVDVVIHLVSTSVPGTEQDALREMNRNVIPSIALFEAAVANGVRRIVFMSSGGTVYGKGDGNGTPNAETDPLRPMNTYGFQKVMIENALRFVCRNSATEYQIIRLSNPYGPGQNPHGPLGLITKLVYQTLHHEQVTIYGDGSVTRDFIYIDDAVQGIIDILRHGNANDTYNLGTGVGVSVRDVVETIQRELPERMLLTHQPGRPVDVPVSVLDVGKYRAISTIARFVPLDEGIRRTARFFEGH